MLDDPKMALCRGRLLWEFRAEPKFVRGLPVPTRSQKRPPRYSSGKKANKGPISRRGGLAAPLLVAARYLPSLENLV